MTRNQGDIGTFKCAVAYCHMPAAAGNTVCTGCRRSWYRRPGVGDFDEWKNRRAVVDLIMREIPSD